MGAWPQRTGWRRLPAPRLPAPPPRPRTGGRQTPPQVRCQPRGRGSGGGGLRTRTRFARRPGTPPPGADAASGGRGWRASVPTGVGREIARRGGGGRGGGYRWQSILAARRGHFWREMEATGDKETKTEACKSGTLVQLKHQSVSQLAMGCRQRRLGGESSGVHLSPAGWANHATEEISDGAPSARAGVGVARRASGAARPPPPDFSTQQQPPPPPSSPPPSPPAHVTQEHPGTVVPRHACGVGAAAGRPAAWLWRPATRQRALRTPPPPGLPELPLPRH